MTAKRLGIEELHCFGRQQNRSRRQDIETRRDEQGARRISGPTDLSWLVPQYPGRISWHEPQYPRSAGSYPSIPAGSAGTSPSNPDQLARTPVSLQDQLARAPVSQIRIALYRGVLPAQNRTGDRAASCRKDVYTSPSLLLQAGGACAVRGARGGRRYRGQTFAPPPSPVMLCACARLHHTRQ